MHLEGWLGWFWHCIMSTPKGDLLCLAPNNGIGPGNHASSILQTRHPKGWFSWLSLVDEAPCLAESFVDKEEALVPIMDGKRSAYDNLVNTFLRKGIPPCGRLGMLLESVKETEKGNVGSNLDQKANYDKTANVLPWIRRTWAWRHIKKFKKDNEERMEGKP